MAGLLFLHTIKNQCLLYKRVWLADLFPLHFVDIGYTFHFKANVQKIRSRENHGPARTHAYPRARTCGNSNPELTTQSHCTSVRVSGDDKWRASQSKPICTSIRRGAKWGSTCIFLPAEKPYISAKTLPRGDGIRGRQRGEGEEGGPFNSNTWGSKVNV